MNNVLVFSKSTLFRNYLVDFLKDFEGVSDVRSTDSLAGLLKSYEENCPDYIVADLFSRSNGEDAIAEICKAVNNNKVIVITSKKNKFLDYFDNIYGVTKFVYADDTLEEIVKCFCAALNGQCVCQLEEKQINLTPRECEILKLIALGQTSKEIAERLCISKNTVDTHRNKMLQKLALSNSASLVQFAYSTGLL
jgi:DNA-binding NarL/FixJ family response regulator